MKDIRSEVVTFNRRSLRKYFLEAWVVRNSQKGEKAKPGKRTDRRNAAGMKGLLSRDSWDICGRPREPAAGTWGPAACEVGRSLLAECEWELSGS